MSSEQLVLFFTMLLYNCYVFIVGEYIRQLMTLYGYDLKL